MNREYRKRLFDLMNEIDDLAKMGIGLEKEEIIGEVEIPQKNEKVQPEIKTKKVIEEIPEEATGPNHDKTKRYSATFKKFIVNMHDHQQFDEFCTRVYTNGFNDGKKSVTEKPVKTITDEQLMEVIGEVKGVGPALRGKIKDAIEAKFGSIGNGKKTNEQEGTAC